MKKRTEKLTPDMRVSDLARSRLLDSLTSSELAVLLRLVAAAKLQGERVRINNSELHESRRTAQRALVALSERGYISVELDEHDNSRTVVMLCL